MTVIEVIKRTIETGRRQARKAGTPHCLRLIRKTYLVGESYALELHRTPYAPPVSGMRCCELPGTDYPDESPAAYPDESPAAVVVIVVQPSQRVIVAAYDRARAVLGLRPVGLCDVNLADPESLTTIEATLTKCGIPFPLAS